MIEAGGRMGRQACSYLLWKGIRTARQLARRVCCGANGDMVWMPIHAIVPKGKDHVWSKGPEYFGHFTYQAMRVEFLELAITVVQTAYMLYAKLLAGTTEFRRPHLPERTARGCMGITDLPRLPLRHGHHHYFCTSRHVFGQGATRTKRLIIGMGIHPEQS